METLREQILIRILKLINAAAVTVPFAVCWYQVYVDLVSEPYYRMGNILIIFLFFVIYIAYGKIYDGFNLFISHISEIVWSQALALFVSNGIMYVIMILLFKHLPGVFPLLVSYGCEILISALWSFTAHHLMFKISLPKNTAIIYDLRDDINEMVSSEDLKTRFHVISIIAVKDALKNNLMVLNGIDSLFLAGIHSHERNIILKKCVEKGIKVYVIPRIGDVIMSGARRLHMFHLPMLQVGRYNPSPEYLFIKRLLDIVLSLIAVVVLSPVFIIVSIAIKLTDHGPVFYRQCRLTKDRKEFYVLKFRSMRVDAEKDGVARLSSGDSDSRVTSVGKVIRKLRIDELPQLLNILKGDMSIVGPRPERPEIAEQYERTLPEFSLRLQAKAGLTGYAQVYGKYNTEPYDKVMMDLMYIANPSLIEDLKIMFATVKILFEPESTEGVESGKTTAER